MSDEKPVPVKKFKKSDEPVEPALEDRSCIVHFEQTDDTQTELLQQQLILLKDRMLTVDIALCVLCSVKQIMQLSVQTVTFERYHLESFLLRDSDNKSTTVDELIKCMQSGAGSVMFALQSFNRQEIVSNRDEANNVCQVDVDSSIDMDSEVDGSDEINDMPENHRADELSLKLTTDHPQDVVSNLGDGREDWEDSRVGVNQNQNLHDYKICEPDLKYNLRNCSVVLSPVDVSQYQTSRLLKCKTNFKTQKMETSNEFKMNSKKRKLSTDVDIAELRIDSKKKTSEKLTNKIVSFNGIEEHFRIVPRLNPDQKISKTLNFQIFRCWLCETKDEFLDFKTLAEHMRSEHCKSVDSTDRYVLCCPESIKGCTYSISFERRDKLAQFLNHMNKMHQFPIPSYISKFHCKYCSYHHHDFKLIKEHIIRHIRKIERGKNKIQPSFFQKQHEKSCLKVSQDSHSIATHPSKETDAKQLLSSSNSDNNVQECAFESGVKNEIASPCIAEIEENGEKLNKLSRDLAINEILSVNEDNSDSIINSFDSASWYSNSKTEFLKTAPEMEHKVSSLDVESLDQVAGFLESETDEFSSLDMNFTIFKCFICNNDRVYCSIFPLIKHVAGAHCRTSETSSDLKMLCFVEHCPWQKCFLRSKVSNQPRLIHSEVKRKYSQLLDHLVSEHKMPVPDYIKPFCCPHCEFKCSMLVRLKMHAKKHEEKVYCEYCGKYLKLKSISNHLKRCLSEHFETEGESYSGNLQATNSQDITDQETIKMIDLSSIEERRRKFVDSVFQQLKLELNTELSLSCLNFISFECFLCNDGNNLESYEMLCDHLVEKHFQCGSNRELVLSCPKLHESCTWQMRFKRTKYQIKRCFTKLLKHLNVQHDIALPAYVRRFRCKISRCQFESVDIHSLAVHMASHDKELVICECGKNVKALTVRNHMRNCPNSKNKQTLQTNESQTNDKSVESSVRISRDDFDESLKNHRDLSANKLDMQEDNNSFALLVSDETSSINAELTCVVKASVVTETSPTSEVNPSFTTESSPSIDVEPKSSNEAPTRITTVIDDSEETDIEMEQEPIITTEVEKRTKSMKCEPSSETLPSAVEYIGENSVGRSGTQLCDGLSGYSKYAIIRKENENNTMRFKCYQCFLCVDSNVEYSNFPSLSNHVKEEHCVKSGDEKIQWKCPFCEHRKKLVRASRKKLMDMLRHMKGKHNFGIPSFIDPHVCKEPGCGSMYLRRYQFDIHQNMHNKSSRSPCEQCGKVLNSNYVKRHMLYCKQTEKRQPPVKCGHCDQQFATKNGLQTHMKKRHAGGQDHKKMCTMCSDCFSSAAYLADHSWKVHNVNITNEPILTCPKCPFQSVLKKRMEVHVREVHTETKSFVCDSCQKCFNSKSKLRTHVKQTHGEQRFSCSECEFVAVRRVNLTQHYTAQHTTVKYSCEVCGYSTGYFANLCKHKKQSSCRFKLQKESSTSENCS